MMRLANSTMPAMADSSGRCLVDCSKRTALRRPGIQCKDENLWQRLQVQTSACPKLTTSAAQISIVPQEENDLSNSAKADADGKTKASGQLARWARARKIRAGKFNIHKKSESISSVAQVEQAVDVNRQEKEVLVEADQQVEVGQDHADLLSAEIQEKCVYMVSDGTGWTADHSVHAALGQFEHCMVDRRCSVNTHLFSDVNDVDRLMEIIRHAGLEGGMVVYTLADPGMADVAKQACEILRIPHIDILGPITEALGNHLGVSPLGLPRGAPGRKNTLTKQYFKRIEAVEFTIKQDDGALPKNLHLADLVLVGVSRTSKTPLSTYIAQKGYKVANVPLVFGIDPPRELFEVDQEKVFGLTINANFLKAIREARYRHLGVAENSQSSYSDMEHIRRELEYSRKLFSQNLRWPVIEVTGKAIEETAAVILRLYHERRNKFSMPRISTRY